MVPNIKMSSQFYASSNCLLQIFQ